MNFYIKQHVFSWADRFTIYDKAGNDVFLVKGEVLTLGKKLHISDTMGNEKVYIEERLLTFLPKYKIMIGDIPAAEIKREFTFFHPQYTVKLENGSEWNVEGEFWEHEYTVLSGNTEIATISKEWFTLGDAYEIRISDNCPDTLLALAVVLTIDATLENNA